MKLPEWLKLLKGSLEDDGDESVDLLFSDQISDGWGGITARDFGLSLGLIPKRKQVRMLINCLGGGVAEGTAMYHLAKARGNVHTCVIGYAASMGSILAQAGVTRTMCKGTIMMVHNPSGDPGYSEATDLEAKAAVLRTIKNGMVDIYNERTKLGKKKISDMMDATTYMDAKEAKELGFIDEISDTVTATASMNPKALFDTYRQLASAPKCAVGDESGIPAQEKPVKQMKALTAALAKLGLVASADLTDEQAIITDLSARFTPIQTASAEVAGLKTQLAAHAAALKLRVEARVQKAIDDKKIKAERKDTMVTLGMSNEASLDFLDDIAMATPPAAPAPGRRGAPPLPVAKGGAETRTNEEQLLELREQMSLEKDPVALAKLAIKARELRGDGDMFPPTTFVPGAKLAAK